MSFLRAERIIWLTLLAALFLGSSAYLLIHSMERIGFYGVLREREAPDFTLQSHDGRSVKLSDFRGRVVLLFFGYTHCPDVCPTTMQKIKQALVGLGDLSGRVQVLFITVDPERDTQDKLSEYVPHFDKSFIGLTGTPQEIKEVASNYNVYYERSYTADTHTGYLMSHTSSVFLITPRGKQLLTYSFKDFDPKLMTEEIKKLLSNGS
jgi:protein SCO1/2